MKEKNITGNYAKLEEVYIQKVLEISEKIGFSYIVWQEVFDNGVKVSMIEIQCLQLFPFLFDLYLAGQKTNRSRNALFALGKAELRILFPDWSN